MAEGMSLGVNVMLSLMSVMTPPDGLVQPIGAHYGEVMYLRIFCFMGDLGFMNCDVIYMCGCE